MSLYHELKRRNVFRVAIAYLALAWLLTEVAGTVFPVFGIPDWGVRFVVIVFALGFLPALIISWVYELTPEGIKREKNVMRDASITHLTTKRLDVFTIGLIVVALAFILVDRLWLTPMLEQRPGSLAEIVSDKAQTSDTEMAESQYPPNSIAVLPFVNMSDDATNEYFSDGVSEEILNSLARIHELKVAGRTSSFAFKSQNQDLRTIGEILKVAHILEGSVRKSGNRVRITAQLIKVEDGYQLWSDSYDRELNDIFAIQDEIAGVIIKHLRAKLLVPGEAMVAAARTSPEVYDLYLLARQKISERKRIYLESAAQLLDKAITLDPEFAPAHAQRGICSLLLSEDLYGGVALDQAQAQARTHLDRALLLRPSLAEALAGLGFYHYRLPGGNALAIQYLEQALVINPNLIEASNWLYFAYRGVGQWQRGLAILENVIERDPLNMLGIGNAAWVYIQMGQQDKAYSLLERVWLYMPENHTGGLEAELQFSLGRFADGLPLAEAAVQLNPINETRRVLGIGLNATHQYQRAIEEGTGNYKTLALWHLGRSDEASTLAYEIASDGYSASLLFMLMNAKGRSEELVEYLEGRWPNLNDFETGWVAPNPQLVVAMTNIALAYARTGNRERFEEVMARIRTKHVQMRAERLDNFKFSLNEASYYVLAGNHEKAMEYLTASIDAGYIGPRRLVEEWPALEPLEGDPRFEAIQARMIEHLNREREQLGLDPLGT